MRLGAIDYSTYTDGVLDRAYSDAYNAKNYPALMSINDEIINRLATPGAFVSSLISAFSGGSNFPLYDQIQATTKGGFVSSKAATESLTQSAGNLVTSAGNVISEAGTVVKGAVAGLPLMMLAGAALAVLFISRRK
jgi:hypothetical protein